MSFPMKPSFRNKFYSILLYFISIYSFEAQTFHTCLILELYNIYSLYPTIDLEVRRVLPRQFNWINLKVREERFYNSGFNMMDTNPLCIN